MTLFLVFAVLTALPAIAASLILLPLRPER